MSGLLVVTALMSALTSQVETSSVSVVLKTAPLDQELRPHLVRELGAQVVSERIDARDLDVQLTEQADALRLVLADADGEVLDRTFPLAAGRVAAFRAVVLAVEQTLSVPPMSPRVLRLPPPPVARPDPLRPPKGPPEESISAPPLAPPTTIEGALTSKSATATSAMYVSAGPTATWAAGAPQLGGALTVQYERSRLRVGGTAAFHGLCCRAAVDSGGATALDGTIQSIFMLATGTYWFVRSVVDIGVTAAVGAERLRLQVVPRIFVGTPSTTEAVRWSAQGRIGVAVGATIVGQLGWRLSVGAFARSHAPRLGLPAGFPLTAGDLEVGRFGPFGAIEAEWKLF